MHASKLNTNFQGKRVPKEKASYKCWSLIMVDSVVKVKKKYYFEILLEECKCEKKKINWNGEPCQW